MKSYSVAIQLKATEQYFVVVMSIIMHKVVLTFKSGDEIVHVQCGNSIESPSAELSCGAICSLLF